MEKIKFIDLFAGIGGFHLSFKDLAECVFASEWDNNARKTYLENFGKGIEVNNISFVTDITTVDYSKIPAFDILCAGFPCQPFSIAGKKQGFTHPTQGTLFFNLIQIIEIHKPKVVFLENVKNLVSHDKGNTFKTIIKSLEDLGYLINHKILNSKTYGNVPQNRERIFIVAFRDKEQNEKFIFPEKIELNKTIKDCLEKKVEKLFYQTNQNSKAVQKMTEIIKDKDSIYQYRRYYVREIKNGICPTLTANMGTGGHNVPLILDDNGVRKLTPRECFNLQGYPNDFKLPTVSNCHLYKQVGNSITVTLVKRIADNIMKTF